MKQLMRISITEGDGLFSVNCRIFEDAIWDYMIATLAVLEQKGINIPIDLKIKINDNAREIIFEVALSEEEKRKVVERFISQFRRHQ